MGKEEIINTRSIGFGSSDAKLLASIGKTGLINKTASKRIAQMLGQTIQVQFSTKSTRYGDYIENEIYKAIKTSYPEFDVNSNPYNVINNQDYKFKCFNHIDIEVLQPKKVIWFEVKAVNDDLEKTIRAYKYQLCWHWWILNHLYEHTEIDASLFMAHYHTKDKESKFDINNLTLQPIQYDGVLHAHILKGVEIVNRDLDNFSYTQDVVVTENLPEEIEQVLVSINTFLLDMKRMEKEIAPFKDKLYQAMYSHGINKIRMNGLDINRVDASEVTKFNQADFMKDHPALYSRYTEKSMRKGYVSIKTKKDEKSGDKNTKIKG